MSIRRRHFKKSPDNQKKRGETTNRRSKVTPWEPPTWGLGHMGGWPMADPHCQNARGSASRPPGQGTPCRVPSSPRSATLLDVLPSLKGQTTFKFDETRIITT